MLFDVGQVFAQRLRGDARLRVPCERLEPQRLGPFRLGFGDEQDAIEVRARGAFTCACCEAREERFRLPRFAGFRVTRGSTVHGFVLVVAGLGRARGREPGVRRLAVAARDVERVGARRGTGEARVDVRRAAERRTECHGERRARSTPAKTPQRASSPATKIS